MSIPKASYKEIKSTVHDMQVRCDKKKNIDICCIPIYHETILSIKNDKKREKLSEKLQEISVKGIDLSLSLAKKRADHGKQVDINELKLLRESIPLIRKQKQRDAFHARLQTLSNKILVVAPKENSKPQTSTPLPNIDEPILSFDQNQIRLLIGEEITLHTLAGEYKQGNEKIGLEKLDALFTMRRVAGDGHCLFRATLASLLYYLQIASDEEKTVFLHQLEQSVNDLIDTNPDIATKYKHTLTSITDVTSGRKTADAILNDTPASNLLVSLLRDLVCAYNFIHGDEVFTSEATLYAQNPEQYFKSMMDMTKRDLGGHPEILALNKILDIEIIALHTTEVGQGKKEPAAYMQQARASGKLPVFLVFRPGHYDLAFPNMI